MADKPGSSSASSSDSRLSLRLKRGGSGSGSKKTIPCRASDWKRENLAEIGVHYHEETLSLQSFMSRVKKDAKYRSVELPTVCEKIIAFTNEIWTSSLDLREATRDSLFLAIQETDESVIKFKTTKNEFKKRLSETEEDETIFEVWKANLLYFWANLKRLLTRWARPGQREASFTNLFMLFSKICLLDPEMGEAYTGCTKVKGVHVHSIPDVRFNTLPHDGQLMLVVVTEVKQYDAFRGEFSNETFCAENLSNRVLGQHGIELVVEAHDSYFAPRVAGMICVGTKVIFTYLDISRTHLTKIEENDTNGMNSSILYTRPFDFMDACDRMEMLKTLFWFGFVQSNAYEAFST